MNKNVTLLKHVMLFAIAVFAILNGMSENLLAQADASVFVYVAPGADRGWSARSWRRTVGS